MGVAATDGAFLWRYDAPANDFGINISTPLHHDGQVFAASAYGIGGGLVKLSRAADGSVQAQEVYFTNRARALRAAGPRRQAGVGAPRHRERQALPARPGPARLRHPGEVTRRR